MLYLVVNVDDSHPRDQWFNYHDILCKIDVIILYLTEIRRLTMEIHQKLIGPNKDTEMRDSLNYVSATLGTIGTCWQHCFDSVDTAL